MSGYRLTTVETVRERGSWAFTAREGDADREVFLVPCADEPGEAEGSADQPVRAWINRCTHEDQRLYREEVGAVTRGGSVVCPKHGSAFDTCEGSCDNGEAAGTTLRSIDVEVRDGAVFLTDDDLTYLYEGLPDENGDDEGPASSSHLTF
ncbi:Rieske iron sulfur protein [Halorubrum distributum JCM 9100]|uniref:Rieske iron sulfur protein n=3 Tax=Halorubrum distributum TaxID=29283 RepID=M0EU99_9EURY|nr:MULTISPECIES: Rieske 2Fe-2S domain-containing protein [Halorubrum distributum group]ELZ51371.1 Rieske iron sulfur protein [Halorubrum distributum JCM 9100]ELZ53141.1 Rieske iron sulfur protein [Halorubrum distributum JCM 10118]MYL16011.1 Rieske 2Fe-2S domain-containing protein [Halorubrum terrestre]